MPPEQHFASPVELLSAINRFQKTRVPFSGDERFTATEGKFELLSDDEGGYISWYRRLAIMPSYFVVRDNFSGSVYQPSCVKRKMQTTYFLNG